MFSYRVSCRVSCLVGSSFKPYVINTRAYTPFPPPSQASPSQPTSRPPQQSQPTPKHQSSYTPHTFKANQSSSTPSAPTINQVSQPPQQQQHLQSSLDVFQPRISVVGVGGAGGNAINHMIAGQLEGVDFLVCNTDSQALTQSLCVKRVQLGANLTRGLGAGAKPEVGRNAAEESTQELLSPGSHLVFLAAGMGGGTGTGATPVIARELKRIDPNALIIAVVTKPFIFEGNHRRKQAEAGILELSQHVDTMIVVSVLRNVTYVLVLTTKISNQRLLSIAKDNTTLTEAFHVADSTLHAGVRTITDLMVVPGLINLDYSDVKSVLMEMRGISMMGVGESGGEGRAINAARGAIYNPLLEAEATLKGARGVLINITGSSDITLQEVDQAASMIRDEADPDANIIFGHCLDPAMKGRMRVSVVCAKGPDPTVIYGNQQKQPQQSQQQPQQSKQNPIQQGVAQVFHRK